MTEFRFPDGHEPDFDPAFQAEADPVDAVGRFVERNGSKYVGLARRRLRRYGVEEATLSPEGAVQEARLRLWRRVKSGEDPPVITQEEWDGRLIGMIKRVTWEKGRWQRAPKRRAPERDPDELALPQSPDRPGRRPDEEADDREYVEWILACLDGKDEQLRSIVVMKLDGHTNEEIARKLGLAVKTVEWKLRQIRSILGPRLRDHE